MLILLTSDIETVMLILLTSNADTVMPILLTSDTDTVMPVQVHSCHGCTPKRTAFISIYVLAWRRLWKINYRSNYWSTSSSTPCRLAYYIMMIAVLHQLGSLAGWSCPLAGWNRAQCHLWLTMVTLTQPVSLMINHVYTQSASDSLSSSVKISPHSLQK